MPATSIKQLEEKVDANQKAILGTLETLISSLSASGKVPIVSPRKHMEAEDQEDPNSGGVYAVDIGDDGHAEILRPQRVDVDSRAFASKQDELAFMEEMVTIDVHPTSNRGEKPVPFLLQCNGLKAVVMPGTQVTLPRKFVGVLAYARPVHFGNEEYTQDDGVRAVRQPSWRTPRIPFSIVEDSPRGKKWFTKVMAAP